MTEAGILQNFYQRLLWQHSSLSSDGTCAHIRLIIKTLARMCTKASPPFTAKHIRISSSSNGNYNRYHKTVLWCSIVFFILFCWGHLPAGWRHRPYRKIFHIRGFHPRNFVCFIFMQHLPSLSNNLESNWFNKIKNHIWFKIFRRHFFLSLCKTILHFRYKIFI